jgi:hypothetical protein
MDRRICSPNGSPNLFAEWIAEFVRRMDRRICSPIGMTSLFSIRRENVKGVVVGLVLNLVADWMAVWIADWIAEWNAFLSSLSREKT